MRFKSFTEVIINSGHYLCGNPGMENEANNYIEQITNWIGLLDCSPSFLTHVLPCYFIYDYRNGAMIHFSPSVIHLLGFDHTLFMGTEGIVKLMDLINPNDFKVYNEQIFPKDMHYMHGLPYEDTVGLTFSNNFRMQQSNGLYKTLLMKKCFITNTGNSRLLYEAGLLIDISSIKKELSITHIIERVYKSAEYPTLIKVVTEDYFPEMHASILSGREKEILGHLAKGTKRKEVGVKLFISDNTVANHIKTILRKTHSQNIREAIDICKMNGII